MSGGWRWVRAQWDRVLGAVAMAGGGVAILAGWFGVSSTTVVAEQIPYVISGGLGGLFLLGVGATLWLSADLRDEWRHLADMEDHIAERLRAGANRDSQGPSLDADTGNEKQRRALRAVKEL